MGWPSEGRDKLRTRKGDPVRDCEAAQVRLSSVCARKLWLNLGFSSLKKFFSFSKGIVRVVCLKRA